MSRCSDITTLCGKRLGLAVLAGVALTSGSARVFAQPGDVAVQAPDIAAGRPQLIISNDPMRFFLPTPAAAPARGPYDPRGSVTFYTSTTQPGNVVNLGTGGCPAGSGVLPDICVDDIPIPAARLTLGSGDLATRIAICQITVGVRQAVGAPSTDVNAWFATVASNFVAPDTAFVTPMTKVLDGTSPVSTLAGSPFLGQQVSRNVPANTTGALRTFEVTVGDGVNPIAGLSSVPLNMNYAVAGGVPATFGTIAIGTQIGETASNTNRLRFTSGPDASLNQIWIYDDEMSNGQAPCSTITTPETGPWAFSATTPVANFYTIVKGTLLTATTPMRCCLATLTASACVVTDSVADCQLSGGTIIAGQTTCGTGVCTPIVCCNNTTGVCSTQFGSCPVGAGVLVAGTSCTGVTCTQPTAPPNDECAAATTGSAFELTHPGAGATLANQVLVGATASAGYAGGINNCTFAPSDVWYLVTLTPAQSTQQWRVTVTPEASSGDYTLQPLAVAVYDGGGGCPAAPGGELVCADFANPQTAFFTGTGSTAYYVRVAYFDPETTKFSIALSPVTIIACCSPTNGLCVASDNNGNCSNPSYNVPAPGGATSCSPTNPCPIGACCGAAGVCALSGAGGCAPANYQGDGTTCTPTNPCGGACCNNTTFACNFTNAAGCGAGSTFTFNGSVCTTAGICPAPPNDLCPGVALSLNTPVTGFISSSTGTDITSCSTSSIDVWYNFTAPATGNYSIKATPATANDVGVAIAIYDAACDPVADTDLDCIPQPGLGVASELLDTLTGGVNYKIRVGGFPGNNGQFSIEVTQPAGLGACCGIGAQCLVVALATDCPAPAEYRGVNTTCAAPATQCPPGACCYPLSGQCFVTLQSFCQGHGGNWNSADTTCGTTTCTQGLPGNDDCNSAFTITSPTYTSNVGTEGASNEGLPAGTCNSAAAQTVGANNSIWYKFTAPSNGILNIKVDDWTGYDLFMSVYTGTCAALTEIGCFDEPEPIEVNATLTNGTTIFIQIAQWDVTAGGGWTSITTTFSATGSCCVGTACTLGVTQAACTGTWNGANSTCTPDPCVPTGICCRGATCNTTTAQASCTTTGFLAGATFPAGPACSGSTFTGCCYGDYNKQGGVTVGDIFDFLNDWFAGSPFANTGGTGAAGPLAVQNIFDFLNSWFAGCV